MTFQDDPGRIVWRVHLATPPEAVFDALDSAAGRASFWAESAVERDGAVHFAFVDGEQWVGEILGRERPHRWSVDYFDAPVTFHLRDDGLGGTDVELEHMGVAPEHRTEVTAGWLNVLLPMKAALDFGVDLHNHDPQRSWRQAYVDH